ncbi:MAG TPA: metallophosphoesterase [Candidatus Thermoplasmatota archaeon]|nr:metallophosphoesterase [Candidatus Thermoplasmatota archaeon]
MRHAAPFLIALLLLPLPASAVDPPHESLAPLGETQEQLLLATLGRIHAIRAPLLARPAFTAPGGGFDAELELPSGANLLSMTLVRGTAACALLPTAAPALAPSQAWADLPSLLVVHARAQVPTTCAPALYDLHVTYRAALGTTEERQVRAVRVMDPARHHALATGAAHPRIVVIADPQIGDPRALVEAAEEDPARIPALADGMLGDGSPAPGGRWKAVRAAFAEARALQPDFVLVAGDLGFGQLVPGSYAVEYEEIWRVLAAADVPLFVAPGNHDGYVANGQDGFAYWRAYIGPTYTLAPSVPGTHVLVLNTYDWSDMDRMGISYGVSAWGGQVREEQLAWAADSLAALRAAQPGARVVAVSHHSPSWRQDAFHAHADGVPVAEQVERGAVTYATTDQGWSGRNRLELRDLLRDHGVEVAFAGHTHHDRVARDDGAGGIVGTFQTTQAMPAGFDPRLLHRWTRDDLLLAGETQAQLAERVRAPTGPLYIDTTTVMSETTQYWGYRPVQFVYGPDGRLDLARFGYAMTQAELDELAHHPELYNAEHASLGLFSKPLRLTMGEPWSLAPRP